MKILITGTHSTGKSTLLDELKKLPELQSYSFIGGITREAKNLGFKINEDGDWKTQLYCAARDVINLLENENKDVIYDRSIIDTFIYTEYLITRSCGSFDHRAFHIIRDLYLHFQGWFDVVFWLRPEFNIENDGVRSLDTLFQKDIDRRFDFWFQVRGRSDIFTLSGSLEMRVQLFRQILYETSIR